MFQANANRFSEPLFDDMEGMEELSFNFAFQPIVEANSNKVVGYEALIRGVGGEPADAVLAGIRPQNRQRFDQAVRVRAIRDASRLGLKAPLHLNCSWLSLSHTRAAMVGMLNAAGASGWRREELVLELHDLEQYGGIRELVEMTQRMRQFHIRLLVDRFGSSTADLSRLAMLRPDMVKLDRRLVAGIHRGHSRQSVVTGIVAMCRSMDIEVIAVGVEKEQELSWLSNCGVRWFQGHYFARPTTDRVPKVSKRTNGVHHSGHSSFQQSALLGGY